MAKIKTKVLLDSSDTKETEELLSLGAVLHGQTTNPSLLAKSPSVKERIAGGEALTEEDILTLYRELIINIADLIPDGPVSIEVHSEVYSSADELLKQGKEMFEWTKNAYVKYPITTAGLVAAERSLSLGMRVNMTLCFSEQQAAAVYAISRGSKPGSVLLSPFIGRLDDVDQNGVSLISNIKQLYKDGDSHVEVLAASVRTMEHFMAMLALEVEQVTAPFSILKKWAELDMPIPDSTYVYDSRRLSDIPKERLSLGQPWVDYDIRHPLTENGLKRFADDWNKLLALE